MNEKPLYNDYPLEVIAESMQRKISEGALTYFKWTCAGCGDRVTANDPDSIPSVGYHEDCGMSTTITKGNFLFIKTLGRTFDGFDALFTPES